MTTSTPPDPRLISYLTLRKALGILGMLLPLALVVRETIGAGRFAILSSVSDYYHSDARDVFVGALTAIGIFLFTYVGYGALDRLVTNVAGAAAIGVAMFPIAPMQPTTGEQVVQVFHILFAGIFFVSMAFQAIFLFRRSTPGTMQTALFLWAGGPGERTPEKVQRDRVYLVAGIVIAVALVLMGVYVAFLRDTAVADASPLFWLETLAIEAFGVAWLVKGQAILADPESTSPDASPSGG